MWISYGLLDTIENSIEIYQYFVSPLLHIKIEIIIMGCTSSTQKPKPNENEGPKQRALDYKERKYMRSIVS